METEDRLRSWMESQVGPGHRFRNPTEWAKKAKIPTSTLHRIFETGRADPQTVIKLGQSVGHNAEAMFRVVGWIDEDEGIEDLGRTVPITECVKEAVAELLATHPIAIPIHQQTASAGMGDDILDYVYWTPSKAAGRNMVALQVHGNSMEPLIEDGDVVIVHWGAAPVEGKIVVVSLGSLLLIKRYQKRDGRVILVGNNGESDGSRAKIEGVVISIQKDV